MISPTQFLYEAAGQPPVPGLLDLEDWQSLTKKTKPTTPPDTSPCYLCGQPPGKVAMPTAVRFKATWTAHATAAAPNSEWLCPACVWSLNEKATHPTREKPFKMRTLSHLVVGQQWEIFKAAEKGQLVDTLLKPPSEQWLLAICTKPTGASHTIYLSPVNPPDAPTWQVNLGGLVVEGAPEEFGQLLGVFEAMYVYHYKSKILSGSYLARDINRQGVNEWSQLEAQLRPYRQTPVLELVSFLAQQQKGVE